MKSNGNNAELVIEHTINGTSIQTHGAPFHGTIDSIMGNPNRFYPEQMPPIPNEPTRDRFNISFIDNGVGEGVTSLVAFNPGDIVFGITGFFSSEVTLFSLQIAPGLHLHDPYFYGKLLHSCDPNTYVDLKTRSFIALKPIEPGEFVTLDYARTEDYLFRTFPCGCGATNCRGYVAGRKQQRKAAKAING
jgi:hypothetical protein